MAIPMMMSITLTFKHEAARSVIRSKVFEGEDDVCRLCLAILPSCMCIFSHFSGLNFAATLLVATLYHCSTVQTLHVPPAVNHSCWQAPFLAFLSFTGSWMYTMYIPYISCTYCMYIHNYIHI